MTVILYKERIRAELERRYKQHPNRLFHALAMEKANRNTLCCVTPGCTSGRGLHGTGMVPFISNHGNLRLYCYACQTTHSAHDLVMAVQGTSFSEADSFLLDLYDHESDERDTMPILNTQDIAASHPSEPLRDCEALSEAYSWSVGYARRCTAWRARQAAALGLPAHALDRPDIGKSYVPDKSGNIACRFRNDGMLPDAGDIVFFNLLHGKPVALKVRHDAEAGYTGRLSRYDQNAGRFILSPCLDSRAFRMCGPCGALCFGHDNIKADTQTVIITEGQTDTLAVDVALKDAGIVNMVSVARDSASHILREDDLAAMANKVIIYCEDPDAAGRLCTQRNMALLQQHGCRVAVWSPSNLGRGASVKDPRELYKLDGGSALVEELLFTLDNPANMY